MISKYRGQCEVISKYRQAMRERTDSVCMWEVVLGLVEGAPLRPPDGVDGCEGVDTVELHDCGCHKHGRSKVLIQRAKRAT